MESKEGDPSPAADDVKPKETLLARNFNPFVQNLKTTKLDFLIFVLMSISLAPLRCIAALFFSCLIWLFATLETRGSGDKDADGPISNPERHEWYMRKVITIARMLLFCCGFWIDVVGELAPPSEAPIVVAAPHSTWIDAFILPFVRLPAVVSRTENKNIPLYGKLIEALHPIFVSRLERTSRTATIDAIKRRVKATQSGHPGYNHHLLLFPEGTCTNRSCLITFKAGAFIPGAPVQPVILRFRNRLDTYSWTFQGQNVGACVWFTFCQPINRVTVEFLPVYKPSPEEVHDSYLYAKNVRAVMAERLGVPTTDHTYEDCRLMMFAESKNYPMSAALVEFDAVRRRLGLSYVDLQNMLSRFSQIDRQRRGKVSLSELAKHLSLPVIEPVRELFSLYDKEGSGLIDFRDFLTGVTLVSEPNDSDNQWKTIFDLFDADGDGRISEDDLTRLLGQNYGMDPTEIEHLMELIDTDHDGLISFTDLMNMIRKRPEYNGMLFVYRKMRRQSVNENQNGDSAIAETSDTDDVTSEKTEESTESNHSLHSSLCEEEEAFEQPSNLDSESALKQRHKADNQESENSNEKKDETTAVTSSENIS